MKEIFVLVFLNFLFNFSYGDVYLNMMRGSNNRFNEANRDRENGNRLFDSQNNNRGGYNVGRMYYYAGTTVPIEWTAQHGCGDPGRSNCEVIIQYMCDDNLRDGSTTLTIPTNRNECYNYNCDTDLRFGRHESYNFYYECRQRTRNRGVFTSNQNLNNGQTAGAIRTRQNPNGDRHGYECPEERDYYPYWSPSPWRDIAIFTNQPQRCSAYQTASQNVSPRYHCVPPTQLLMSQPGLIEQEGWIPIDPVGCASLKYYDKAANKTYLGQWVQVPAFNSSVPFCIENAWSRENHHGNILGGFPQMWNWTVPADIYSESCALRIRYNISTLDLSYWTGPDSISPTLNSTFNSRANPDNKFDPAAVPIWSNFSLTAADVPEVALSLAGQNSNTVQNAFSHSRQYVLRNNPQVDAFGFGNALRLQLAINTAQYGRTFEDRSHRFAIRPRPADIPANANIRLLSVRGKRGNIVQVYPAVEYDFHPNRLEIGINDWIHIQWTGSNTNPDNNAGEGKAGTDRSNMVLLREKSFDDGQPGWLLRPPTFPTTSGSYANYYPANIQNTSFLGLPYTDLQSLAVLSNVQFGGSMSQLDDAGTYFDLGPRQITTTGVYHYLCTRNNNFSNRNQVGKIKVSFASSVSQALGINGGNVTLAGSSVFFAAGSLASLTTVTLQLISRSPEAGLDTAPGSNPICAVAVDNAAATGTVSPFTLNCPYSAAGPLSNNNLYYSTSLSGSWSTVSADFSTSGVATTSSNKAGYYSVDSELNGGAIAGIVIAIIIFIGALVGGLVWFFKFRKGSGGGSSKSMSTNSAVVQV